MGFDITRAVRDAFGGRTPVLDRLLSYMYFADMAVVEQSFWDDFGGGVSVVGVRKLREHGTDVVLAGPLPVTPHAIGPGGSPGSGELGLDAARLVDLMARVWAASEVDPSFGCNVTLVAYRPDPAGISLDLSMPAGLGPGAAFIGFAPVGTGSGAVVPAARDLRTWRFALTGMRGARTRGPAAGVARITCRGTDHPDCVDTACLGQVREAVHRCGIEPLYVHPTVGSDFQPPGVLVIDAAVRARDPVLPAGWSIGEPPGGTVRLGGGADVLCATASLLARLNEDIASSWNARGGGPGAFEPARLLALDAGPGTASVLVGAVSPPGAGPTDEEVERTASEAAADEGLTVELVESTGRAGPPAGGEADDRAQLLDLPPVGSEWVTARFECSALAGPTIGEAVEDPVNAAKALGFMYLDAIRRIGKRGTPWG